MKNLKITMRNTLYLVLFVVFITSCGYPHHTVCEGRQNMIVYKMEKVDDAKFGTYKYAVTDASGKDWKLYSFNKFAIGDTLHIANTN